MCKSPNYQRTKVIRSDSVGVGPALEEKHATLIYKPCAEKAAQMCVYPVETERDVKRAH